MFKFLKEHYLALILAVFIGIITLSPQFFAIQNMGDKWQGVYPTVNDDEIYYQSRGQEIVDGHYFLTNPYLVEHKEASPMQFFLPDFLVAFPLKIFNIPISVGYKIYDFLWPLVLSLLSYLIVFNLTKLKSLSLLSTSVLHLGIFLSLFNRGPSPQFIFIFWLLLTLFIILFEKTKEKKYIVLSSIVFGLLFYMYPYYWTFYVIFLVIYIFLKFLLEKDFKWKNYLWMILGTGVISIPYFILYWQSTKLESYYDSVIRLGLLNTHFPSGIKIVFLGIVVLALMIFSVYKKKLTINKRSLLIFSGILACLIAVNHHIITGKNLEFSSHYYHLSIAWYVFSVFYLMSLWPPVKKKFIWFSRIGVLLILGWVVFSTIGTINRQITPSQRELEWQKYGEVLDWLKANTEKDTVVFASQSLSSLIPAYTSNNVFFAREANLFFIGDEEVEKRFIINNYWQDFSDEFIKQKERSIWGTQYINSYAHNQSKNKIKRLIRLNQIEYDRLPQTEIDRIKSQATEIRSVGFLESVNNYQVDYLIWDKDDDWANSDFESLEQLAELNNFKIYKF